MTTLVRHQNFDKLILLIAHGKFDKKLQHEFSHGVGEEGEPKTSHEATQESIHLNFIYNPLAPRQAIFLQKNHQQEGLVEARRGKSSMDYINLGGYLHDA